jgi:hypothetical protein
MGKDKATLSLIPLKSNISYRLFVSLFKLKDEHRTSNSPQASKHLSASGGSNVESEKGRPRDGWEELIKIFVTSIKTTEKKPRLGVVEYSVLGVCFFIRRWTFDVRCWMFIFLNPEP